MREQHVMSVHQDGSKFKNMFEPHTETSGWYACVKSIKKDSKSENIFQYVNGETRENNNDHQDG